MQKAYPTNRLPVATSNSAFSSRTLETSAIAPAALKLKDAAQYLGISPVSVRRLIARGLIKPVRALRHVLISIAELDRFLASS
jgi:excisionase family DNA binding protein